MIKLFSSARNGMVSVEPRSSCRPVVLWMAMAMIGMTGWESVSVGQSPADSGGPADSGRPADSRRPADSLRPADFRPTTVQAGARAGIRRYLADTWGIVAVDLVNRSDRAVVLPATLYFKENPTLQFARRFWLPPNSKRHSWCPVRLPPLPEDQGTVELVSLNLKVSGDSEVVVRNSSGELRPSYLLPVSSNRASTSIIGNREESDPAAAAAAGNAVVAMREAAGLAREVGYFFGNFLPPTSESLQGLSYLVLCGDGLASDTAAITAIRRWLHGGGRLWVMLDRVDPATVELLLGNAFDCHLVDRVGLTSVRIEADPAGTGVSESSAREFEEPVELARVLTSNKNVMQRVNGWPVSFQQPVGKGLVLLTTLGPRGWLRLRTRADPQIKNPRYDTAYIATGSLDFLASQFITSGEAARNESPPFESYLSEQIGYRIVGRRWVATVLGGFCLALAAAGIWYRRSGRLERLLWIVPAAAVMAGAALLLVGRQFQRAVPPTVAVAQLIHGESDVEDVYVTGLMSIYSQRPYDGPLGASRGGMFFPDMSGLEGVTRRMVWTDIGNWHWENLTLPKGIRTAPFQFGTKIDGMIDARGTFGPAGFHGTFQTGPFQAPSDAIIALPSGGKLAVAFYSDGTFSSGRVLTAGEFIDAPLLDSRQHRRQSVYQRLLEGENPTVPIDRPLLMAWTESLEMQFQMPAEARKVGSAVLTVPLEIERPPPGTNVLIPSPFTGFRSIHGPEDQISAAYFNARREWLPMHTPSRLWLRFQMPPEVLPLRVKRATLTVKINAPGWTVKILGRKGETQIPLAESAGPVGDISYQIEQPDALSLDEAGGLVLGISVGDATRVQPRSASTRAAKGALWKIDFVTLKTEGQTLPRDS